MKLTKKILGLFLCLIGIHSYKKWAYHRTYECRRCNHILDLDKTN